jgi:hypothetical protein
VNSYRIAAMMAQIDLGHLQALSKAILEPVDLPQHADPALPYALTRGVAHLLSCSYAP